MYHFDQNYAHFHSAERVEVLVLKMWIQIRPNGEEYLSDCGFINFHQVSWDFEVPYKRIIYR